MKKLLALSLIVLVGVAGWRLGASLDSDAISMAVGVFFGVLAGIPAALLVLAARRADPGDGQPDVPPMRYERSPYAQQPPVIVVTPGAYGAPPIDGKAGQPHYYAQPPSDLAPRPERQFRIVGEEEAWIED